MVAGPGAIKAGEAFIEISGDGKKLDRALKKSQGRLAAFGQKVQMVGKQLLKVGAISAAAFAPGVIAAARFEEQMAKVATLLSESDLAKLPQLARGVEKLSAELGESTETLSKGLFDIISASVPVNQALAVLEASAKGAAAGMTDTGTAADAVTTLLNAYGLAASEAASISDLLFSINKRGKTTFGELAQTIGSVASTAASGGLSLEEMGAALATMTRNGVKTTEAITALNAIVSGFLSPTSEAAEEARKLGFELNTTTLKTEGLLGVFTKLKGVPTETIAKIFPNIRALRGVLPAINDLTGFTFDLAQMNERAGATQEAFGRQTKTLMFAFRQLKQTGVDLLRAIGTPLLEGLTETAKSMAGVLKVIANWVRDNPKLVKTLAQVTVGVVAVGAAIVGAKIALLAFGALLSPAGIIIGGIIIFKDKIMDLIGGTKGLAIAWENVKATIQKAVVISTDLVIQLAKAVADTFRPVVEGIIIALGELITAANLVLDKLGIEEAFSETIKAARNAFKDIGSNIHAALSDEAKQRLQEIEANRKAAIKNILMTKDAGARATRGAAGVAGVSPGDRANPPTTSTTSTGGLAVGFATGLVNRLTGPLATPQQKLVGLTEKQNSFLGQMVELMKQSMTQQLRGKNFAELTKLLDKLLFNIGQASFKLPQGEQKKFVKTELLGALDNVRSALVDARDAEVRSFLSSLTGIDVQGGRNVFAQAGGRMGGLERLGETQPRGALFNTTVEGNQIATKTLGVMQIVENHLAAIRREARQPSME